MQSGWQRVGFWAQWELRGRTLREATFKLCGARVMRAGAMHAHHWTRPPQD